MATVDDALQSQIRNIETTYGRPMDGWFAVIADSGLTKHTDVVAMLKTAHGMTHGAAHRVSLLARQAAEAQRGGAPAGARDGGAPAGARDGGDPAGVQDGGDPAGALYAGRKAGLRPIHDALMRAVAGLGGDVELVPKKGYVSLRRRKQFAMIQPSTATRVDVGLILKDTAPDGRLEAAGGFNALFTHRVRLTGVTDVDPELVGWLARAYDQAG